MQEPEMICELDYKYRKMNFPMTFDFLDVICFPVIYSLKPWPPGWHFGETMESLSDGT